MSPSVQTLRFVSLLMGLLLSGCGGSNVDQVRELASQGLYTAALAKQGEMALIGSLNHGASLWRVRDHERLFNWAHQSGEFTELVACAFSDDGTRAVTTDPRTLVVWDTNGGESLGYWATPGAVLDVALLPNGHEVLLGLEDHSALVFDASEGAHRHTLLHEGQVNSVAVSGDGRFALTGAEDDTARLWSLDSGELLATLPQPNPVRQVAISATGDWLFTASDNQAVQVWRGDGQPHKRLYSHNPGITSARFSDDGTLLLLGLVSRSVELWQVSSGKRLKRWSLAVKNPWRPIGSAVLAVSFAASEGRYKAVTGDGQLSLLSL